MRPAGWRRPAGVPGRRGERRVRADLAAPGRFRPVGVAVFDAVGGPPLSLTRAVPPRVRRKGADVPAAGGGRVAVGGGRVAGGDYSSASLGRRVAVAARAAFVELLDVGVSVQSRLRGRRVRPAVVLVVAAGVAAAALILAGAVALAALARFPAGAFGAGLRPPVSASRCRSFSSGGTSTTGAVSICLSDTDPKNRSCTEVSSTRRGSRTGGARAGRPGERRVDHDAIRQIVSSGFTDDQHRQFTEWTHGPTAFERLRGLSGSAPLADLPAFVRSLGISPELMRSGTFQGTPVRRGDRYAGHFFVADKHDPAAAFTAED